MLKLPRTPLRLMDGSRRVTLLRAIRKVSCMCCEKYRLIIRILKMLLASNSAIVDRKKELIKYKGWQGL